jgi:hypothetical protein
MFIAPDRPKISSGPSFSVRAPLPAVGDWCTVRIPVSYAHGSTGYTALVKQAGDWWVGRVQEVPGVNAQERTKEELLVSLKAALREAPD